MNVTQRCNARFQNQVQLYFRWALLEKVEHRGDIVTYDDKLVFKFRSPDYPVFIQSQIFNSSLWR